MGKSRIYKMIKKTQKGMEILIPAYNEEGDIEQVIKNSLDWLKNQTKDYSVLAVDDGSTDNTGKLLDALTKKDKHIRAIHHEKNKGIGESWRTLYKNSSKEILFTCPADQQFNPADFSRVIPYLDRADFVSIYRERKEQYSLFKKFLTLVNKLLIRFLFGFNLKDVNWVKMYKREKLLGLDLKLKSPLVETEIFAKAKKRNYKIIEIPAPHHPRIHGKSKGSNMKQLSGVFKELFRLFFITIKFK